MSYIRALSNPEGLYVYRNWRGQAEFCGVPDWGGKHIHDKNLTLPAYIFEGLMLKFLRERVSGETFTYRGASLIQLDQARLGYKPLDLKDKKTWHLGDPDLYKWRLTYPENWGPDGVNAWEVTWCYVAQNIFDRRLYDNRNKSSRKKVK